MMWPIFWPTDTDFSNPANTRHPSEDLAADGKHIAAQIAAVVAATGTSADPGGYAEAVVQELYPDVLTYIVGAPATLRVRHPQRPDDGGQRARGDAVTGHEHGRALRAQAIRSQGPAGQPVPLCSASMICAITMATPLVSTGPPAGSTWGRCWPTTTSEACSGHRLEE